MRVSPRSSAGFTLIETLVALFIVALLSAGGGVLLMQALQAGKQVDERTEQLIEAQIAHALMRDDFGAITLRRSNPVEIFEPPQGFVGRRAVSGEAAIEFVRGGWASPGNEMSQRSDLQRVEYRIENRRLIRKAWLRPDPTGETPIVERVIAQDFEAIELRYAKANQWFEDWVPEPGDSYVSAPDAIELTLFFGDGDELKQIFLTGARS